MKEGDIRRYRERPMQGKGGGRRGMVRDERGELEVRKGEEEWQEMRRGS